jgi:hypothetical protein
VLSRFVRARVSYLHTRFGGGAGRAPTISDRKLENLLLARTQLNF